MGDIIINVDNAKTALVSAAILSAVYLFMEVLRRLLIWPLFPTDNEFVVALDGGFQFLTLFVMLTVLMYLLDE